MLSASLAATVAISNSSVAHITSLAMYSYGVDVPAYLSGFTNLVELDVTGLVKEYTLYPKLLYFFQLLQYS